MLLGLWFGAATASELVVGGQIGLLAWQRAGDHGALLAPRAVGAIRLDGSPLGLTLELEGAVARERNEDVRSTTWPLRAAVTADVVVRRVDAVWTLGVGPGTSVQVSRLRSGDQIWSGVTVRPVLRAQTGLELPLAGSARWRLGSGIGVRPAGIDWDVAFGVVVAP